MGITLLTFLWFFACSSMINTMLTITFANLRQGDHNCYASYPFFWVVLLFFLPKTNPSKLCQMSPSHTKLPLPHLPLPQFSQQPETQHHFSCPITATVVPLLKDSAGTLVKKGLSYKKRWIIASPFSILHRNEMSELAAVFFSAPSATGHCRNYTGDKRSSASWFFFS